MVKLLDLKLQRLARDLVRNDKVVYSSDAEKDILKCNYSKELLKENFELGVLIEGKELYNDPKHHNRNYCISCYRKKISFGIFGKHYNLIAWNFTNDLKKLLIFIHTSPCGGYEKKVYKRAKKIKEPSP